MDTDKAPDASDHPDPPEENPGEPELEVEGPNESAPGHEPEPSGTPESSGEESK